MKTGIPKIWTGRFIRRSSTILWPPYSTDHKPIMSFGNGDKDAKREKARADARAIWEADKRTKEK